MKTLGKGRLGKIWALLAATGAFALVTAGVAMPASADTPAAYLNPTETTLVCVHEQTRIQVVADVVVPDGAPATTVTVTGTDANGGVALTFAPSPQTAASSGKYTFTAPINRNSNSFTYNVHLDGVTFGSGGVNGAPPQDCGVPEKPDTPPASTTEPTSEWADVDPPEVDYVNETKKQVRDLTTTDYEWVLVDNEWVESVVDTTTTQEYRWVDADDYELNPDSGGGTTDPGDNPDNGGGTPDDGENPDDGGDQPTDPGNTPDDDSDDTPVGGDDSSNGSDAPTDSSDDSSSSDTKDTETKDTTSEAKSTTEIIPGATPATGDMVGSFPTGIVGVLLAMLAGGFGVITIRRWARAES